MILMSPCGSPHDVAQHQEPEELSSLFYMIEGLPKVTLFSPGNCSALALASDLCLLNVGILHDPNH